MAEQRIRDEGHKELSVALVAADRRTTEFRADDAMRLMALMHEELCRITTEMHEIRDEMRRIRDNHHDLRVEMKAMTIAVSDVWSLPGEIRILHGMVDRLNGGGNED